MIIFNDGFEIKFKINVFLDLFILKERQEISDLLWNVNIFVGYEIYGRQNGKCFLKQ